MTLNTSIAIGRPHPVREVFDFCRGLIDTPSDVPVRTGEHDGDKWIGNPIGMGLCALLDVTYGQDGPLVHRCWSWCHEHECDKDEDSPRQNGWSATIVSFDTAYSYRGENGESCSDLHARLVRALGQWLDARGLPWKWQNEYTGEWFDGYDGLDEFGDAHKATGADDWFRNAVMPAILSGFGGSGSDVD